ncbi:MAG TPA: DNA polymerase I, partial [Aggregicoccus sp.]|nr:DNA polymerase I [Aggregicoccus sp.]
FALIRRVVEALNIPALEMAGWEADDVIGTLAKRAKAEGFCVLVVTGDKDFVQIVDEDVRLFDPMNDRRTGLEDVKERLGIEPRQMRDYLALIGDAVDNVAKVPGIGPKTAVELLTQFGDVESLLARLPEVKKPKTRQALESHRDSLQLAKKLVTFNTELPLDVKLEELARRPPHEAQVRDLFSELEFFKLLQEMPTEAPTPLAHATQTVEGAEALRALAEAARSEGRLFLVPAYEGLPYAAELVGLGVALPSGKSAYVPLGHRVLGSVGVTLPQLSEVFGPLLADPAVKKGGHDLKSLLLLLSTLGLRVEGAEDDVELLSYLLNPSRREHALVDLARERLRAELPPAPASAGGKKGRALADHTAEELCAVYGTRADAARRMAPELWKELEGAGLAKLARELEVPLLPILAQMERHGVKVDLATLAGISELVDVECQTKLKEVHTAAGREFNVGSNLQLAQVLYTELQLPVLKRGKTGPSTDQEVLEKLAQQHPVARAIIEYRTLSKLKSTYLDTLPSLVARDGRIHTTYHQAATATGRLSSSDPNLQNIPLRTEVGRKIRSAFVAEAGHQLVSADYSQVELRLLAHMAEDAVLLDAFANDEDIHSRTAAEVFGVPPAQVTRDQRRVAKMVNFGIAYGLSAHGLSGRLDIPVEEARDVIERYFTRYAGIRRYLEDTVEQARKRGYVETLFGRRRLMGDLL